MGSNIFSEPAQRIKLSAELNEISGLAVTNAGKLLGHNDEDGIVFQIDPDKGKIIKKFQLGKFGVSADFEGIAFAEKKLFLISSDGYLFEFLEGTDRGKVSYRKTDLGFSRKFEIEGLCYDAKTNSLLISPKNYAGKKFKGFRAIYSFSLKNMKMNKDPVFLISLKELEKRFNIKDFYPSGIAVRKKSGNIFILSSKGRPALVEITPDGKIARAVKLRKKLHPQPEGIAFVDENILIISDESKGKGAYLTKYRLRSDSL